MNKYQEALDKIKSCTNITIDKGEKYELVKNKVPQECFDTLQELIDKYEKIKYPRFIPCKCGYNRRHGYYNTGTITFECIKCGIKVSTQGGESKAIRHWNEVMNDK